MAAKQLSEWTAFHQLGAQCTCLGEIYSKGLPYLFKAYLIYLGLTLFIKGLTVGINQRKALTTSLTYSLSYRSEVELGNIVF